MSYINIIFTYKYQNIIIKIYSNVSAVHIESRKKKKHLKDNQPFFIFFYRILEFSFENYEDRAMIRGFKRCGICY